MNLLLVGVLIGIVLTFAGSATVFWVLVKLSDRAALRAQRDPRPRGPVLW